MNVPPSACMAAVVYTRIVTHATALAEASFLGIRSRTQLTEKVPQRATRLALIGCFCIALTRSIWELPCLGIPVFNAPFSNTRSVAELVLA